VAEGVHAGRPHDEVQAGGEQRGDQQVDHQHRGVGRAGRQQRQRGEHQRQPGGSHDVGGARAAQRLFLHADVAARRLRPAEQAPGAPHQHDGHHEEVDHQRELGERHVDAEDLHHAQPDAHGLDLGDEQRGHVRAGQRAHAADHHDDEGGADGVQVHLQRGGFARQLQRAAQAREQRAEREHGGEEPGLVDAERADHLAVLRGGAHQRAEARAREQQPHEAEHQRADDDQEQVVGRKLAPEDFDRALQARRARAEQFVRAPEPQHRVLDDQHQREGGQQLEQLGRLVDAAQQQHLDERTQHAHRERGDQQRRPEAHARAELLDQRVRDVDAHHEKRSMGEVDDARHAEDQREAGRHQEQRRRAGQPVEQLNNEA